MLINIFENEIFGIGNIVYCLCKLRRAGHHHPGNQRVGRANHTAAIEDQLLEAATKCFPVDEPNPAGEPDFVAEHQLAEPSAGEVVRESDAEEVSDPGGGEHQGESDSVDIPIPDLVGYAVAADAVRDHRGRASKDL